MLYIFDKDDKFQNIITEDTGLIETWFKDYQNHLIDEPFKFHVDSESELLPLIVAENQVAFYDRANRLRLMRIKEPFELYDGDGYVVEVMAEPSWLELHDHFVEDRRVVEGQAQTALNRALDGSRYTGDVQVELGLNTTNFYWIDAVEAIFNTIDTWGGSLVDTIELDENNEIIERKILIVERLGADNGLLIQPAYNAETIERRTLSYPITAMWGQGASLEIEDDEGELTGGHTRYITFEDVEWKKSKGDPVDKPKGQKWVGDPEALAKYGYLKDDSTRMHRYGHFSNQDYEEPEELLKATWQALQEEKDPEVYHEAVIDEVDKDVFLGDTATILDRHYGKPIEVQSQLTGIEYDILEPNENVKVVVGNYKDMSRDPLEDDIDEIKNNQKKPVIVDSGNFPDKKPMKPTNVQAVGGWETIQLTWDYTDEIFVSHYEVYASQNKDFVPDSQFLVYNGKVSAFGHEVKTDEVWYYRVCAVNYRGTKSDFSDEATSSTIRIPLEATNFENIVNDAKDAADEAYDNANIATGNAATAINKAQDSFDKALEALSKSDENEQSILTLNIETGNIIGRIESVNTRLDDLDGDDRNLITHLPQRWEQGYVSTNTGNNNVNGNPNYIRALDYFDLKADEEYTLTSYGDYRITLFYYDENHDYLDEYVFVLSDIHRTFTTPSEVKYARVGIDGLSNEIDTLMLGVELKVKLQKGSKSSDWTPNLSDTAEFVHEFQLTANSLASRISDNEGNINQIANTVDGWQQTISDVEGNLNTVTNLASANQQQISSVEGDVNTLTSTANSLVSRLDNSGGRNLIENSRGDSLEGWNVWSDTTTSIHTFLDKEWIRVSRVTNRYVGIYTPRFDVKANKTYTISFTIRSYYHSGNMLNYLYLSKDVSSVKGLSNVNMSDDKFEGDISGEGVRVWFTFSHDEDIQDARILLAISDRPDGAGFLLREVQVEQSEVVNPWKPASEDMYSQFSQLQEAISLRVKEGDLLTQINLEADRLLIDTSGKLILSAESTLIENAIIDDAHITNLSGEKILSKSIIADKLDVTKLSAITSDLGLATAGQLKSQNDRVFFDLNQGQLNINNGAINITRPDNAVFIEDGIPKFSYNVPLTEFLDEGVVFNRRWHETKLRGSQRYKVASFRHEGRRLKMNVITQMSWDSPSQGEYMYFGIIPLNGKVITKNYLERVNVQRNESSSHIFTVDLGTPTYQEESVYLVFYKERLDNGGSHDDNIVQIRTNRIWQEG